MESRSWRDREFKLGEKNRFVYPGERPGSWNEVDSKKLR